jgi:DNA sulfur modification protein DndC
MSKAVPIPDQCQKTGNIISDDYLEELYRKVQEVYLADNRPWVVGYSGGKDSTATLQLVWNSLRRLPRNKMTKTIFVISSDTFVETPVIVNYINTTLERINIAANEQNLPIEAHKVTPLADNTFWVNLIGRGYPAPYSKFRWCTDRLKIEPANRFITGKITSYGEVVVVLGARRAESATRAGQMDKRTKVGEHLTRHSSLVNAWVFTPIEDWYTEEVWEYLLSSTSPWGSDNEELLTMYKNAQDGECPLVIDKSSPSCGNSRFGCWVCTVVTKDSSMASMIDKGEEWLRPLLDFRDWLLSTQDPTRKKEIRDVRRRTGRIQFKEINGENKIIWGPYLLFFRKEILKRLLETQIVVQKHGPNPKEQLITEEELLKIRQLWLFEEGDWQDSLPQIYEKVTGAKLALPKDDWSGLGGVEFEILLEVCEEHGLPVELLTQLFDAERRQQGMGRRSAIYNEIDAVLKKDWSSREEVLKKVGLPLP